MARPRDRRIDDDDAMDRIAHVFASGMPDGLRASTEALEAVARMVRLSGRVVEGGDDNESEDT